MIQTLLYIATGIIIIMLVFASVLIMQLAAYLLCYLIESLINYVKKLIGNDKAVILDKITITLFYIIFAIFGLGAAYLIGLSAMN